MEVLSLPLFSDGSEGRQPNPKIRTEAGQLSASTLKAIGWFSIEHGLKPSASSALPIVKFTDKAGEEYEADIAEVLEAYATFKKENHGKRHA